MHAMAVITFSYSCNQRVLSEMAMDFATNVGPQLDGLRWKAYLNDQARRRAAGVYLFCDRQTARAYEAGPHVQALRESPMVADVHAEVFAIMDDPSLLSHAPLDQ
jgi:hypothetical protein